MFVIRPIKPEDIDQLMQLLSVSGHGLTSLPKDEKIIQKKITQSTKSFDPEVEAPGGESYLFVMEEVFTGKLVGVSGIISKIGGFEAYYFYRLKEEIKTSKMLGISKNIRTLSMEKTHSGPAEICSLFLHPDYRNSQNGRFLSLSRFLYMAENQNRFEEHVIAEMRGQVNEQGQSPFWNAVGSKFTGMDFIEADYLTMKSKSFIDELVPNYPIIVELLPEDAQDVVGKVHDNTRPAKHILEQEGFEFKGLVGIFEPGPVLETELKTVRSFADSKVIKIKEILKDQFDGTVQIISTSGANKKFKATLGHLKIEDGEAIIEAVTATALKLKVGDSLRYVSFKPEVKSQKLEV
ncbi:MAG: arginine N-succinyltransferase [Halobacteriovoraceae bacterium]|nr:arginine N-succinyltransferase [Halobacteriovoraceae bacterium]